MHLAAMYNHSSCIDALLKHQSEAMDMRNDVDMTPLQVYNFRLYYRRLKATMLYNMLVETVII